MTLPAGRFALPLIVGAMLAFCAHAFGQSSNEGYVPLARAKIALGPHEMNELMGELNAFASAGSFRLVQGNFPKAGRPVVNVVIYVAKDSFIRLDNFIEPCRPWFAAYSHDADEAWRPAWRDLITRLSSHFGVDRVAIEGGGEHR